MRGSEPDPDGALWGEHTHGGEVMENGLKVGDRVRSFDFESRDLVGARACYIEGTVLAIGVPPREVCNCEGHYHVRVDRQVFGGVERKELVGRMVYPPVNGTPGLFGATNGVEVVR
jgi:hypothetical protein